jgi:hypothetical protein
MVSDISETFFLFIFVSSLSSQVPFLYSDADCFIVFRNLQPAELVHRIYVPWRQGSLVIPPGSGYQFDRVLRPVWIMVRLFLFLATTREQMYYRVIILIFVIREIRV